MLALPQDYVRQVLGNARFLLARRRDAEMLDEAIATASPEANHAMAVWDPQGKGYCAETVAYDLANLATNSIHRIRVHSTRNNPVNFAFEIEVGDYVFRMRGTQLHRGGDILAKVVGRVRSAPLDAACLQNMPVLAVDDNAINRHILAEILSRWGMNPTLTTSADEALTLMQEAQAAGKPFPLVIVDAQMPIASAADASRSRPRASSSPVSPSTSIAIRRSSRSSLASISSRSCAKLRRRSVWRQCTAISYPCVFGATTSDQRPA